MAAAEPAQAGSDAPPPSLEGVVVIVTGGTSGIGATTSKLLGSRKATVVVAGRSVDKGQAVADEVVALGGKAAFIKTDVTKTEDITALISQCMDKFGRLDAVFCNAGFEGTGKHILNESTDDVVGLFQVNVVGPVVLTVEAAKAMLKDEDKTRRKVIVYNSSIASGMPKPTAGAIGWYSTTKSAIDSVTRVAAGALEEKSISVYSVNPGAVKTPMIEKAVKFDTFQQMGLSEPEHAAGFNDIGPERNRLIMPEEIAAVVVHMIDGTTKWETGDSVYSGPGATTIHMSEFYKSLYESDAEKRAEGLRNSTAGYDESGTIPKPLA